MPDAELTHLHPALQPKALRFLELCESQFSVKITITYRSADSQMAAYGSGHSKALPGQSPHNCVNSYGLPASKAFDFAILDPSGSYIKNGADARYYLAGKIGKSIGLAWGGDWHRPDYDHLELQDWQYIR